MQAPVAKATVDLRVRGYFSGGLSRYPTSFTSPRPRLLAEVWRPLPTKILYLVSVICTLSGSALVALDVVKPINLD